MMDSELAALHGERSHHGPAVRPQAAAGDGLGSGGVPWGRDCGNAGPDVYWPAFARPLVRRHAPASDNTG